MDWSRVITAALTGLATELRGTPEGQAIRHLFGDSAPRSKRKAAAAGPRPVIAEPEPPPPVMEREPSSVQTIQLARAALVLASFSTVDAETILDNDDARRKAFREAVKRTHPDRGGEASTFQRVMWAKEVLSIV